VGVTPVSSLTGGVAPSLPLFYGLSLIGKKIYNMLLSPLQDNNSVIISLFVRLFIHTYVDN
jgi:hypothetical protein